MVKEMTLLVEESDSCKKNSRSSEESFDLVRPGHIRFPIVFQRISTSSWSLVHMRLCKLENHSFFENIL